MLAEIIPIGDEILIGQVIDTNSNWIAGELNNIGISVFQITAIQDKREHIVAALEAALTRVDLVLLCGGLGPTNDDITKKTLCDFFGDTLIFHEETANFIRAMFEKTNYPFTEVNRQQAFIPSRSIPLKNTRGTAPGMWFDQHGKIIISLPGVPNEMKGIMTTAVLPKLTAIFNLPYILHKTINTYGMGESMVAERIASWEAELSEDISLAYLPSYGKLRLRLTAKGFSKKDVLKRMEEAVSSLTPIIADILVGMEEEQTIEHMIGELLREKQQTIALAESCTGGNIAKMITSIPGASNYFVGGIVAYTKQIKLEELGLSKRLIEDFSVVSSEVAEAMATQIRLKFNTDFGVSTTGNAGPTTDDTDTEVGTVFVGISTANSVYSEQFYFGNQREKVIERTSNKALELLRKEILKNR